MLDLIRKKQKSVIVKFVFWAIIATFVGTIFLVWGKGRDGGDKNPTVAITVNGAEIGFPEFQNAYNNLYRLYQNIYRDQFTPALEKQLAIKKQARESLIEETLLLQEADKLGITISKKDLVDSIAQVPAFQDNGTFSKERYLQVLAYQRMTPEDFETLQKRQLLIAKAREHIEEGATVTDADIEKEYLDQNEKVNLDFIKFVPALFESKVAIDSDALAAYFTEHREEFRIPETIALQYLVFDPAKYLDEITFTDGDVEKYYNRHLDQFEIPEQVKIAHILIKIPDGASKEMQEKKTELANKILEEARAGKDFSALARRYSDDAKTAANGGELGYITRRASDNPFVNAAFALKPGELSEVVQTPLGLHIIKCEGHIEAGLKSPADAAAEVKAGLKEEKARQLAMEKAMDAYNINRKTGDLQAAAQANGLTVKETGFFSRQDDIEGLGQAPEISASAFILQAKELGRPVALPQGVILYAVKEKHETRLPELDEVRKKVEAAYRSAKSHELAKDAAEKALGEIKSGQSLAAVARKLGLRIEETGLFARSYGSFIPRIGDSTTLAQAAFTLTSNSPAAPEVYTVNDQFLVAALKNREDADPKSLTQTLRDSLRETLLARKRNQLLDDKLTTLREQADLYIAPALMED